MEQICNKLKNEYNDIDFDTIKKDVCSFIDYLIKEEVLFMI